MKRQLPKYLCFLWCMGIVTVALAGCHRDNSTTATVSAPNPTPATYKTRSYLALGDSYTIGQSIDSPGRYPAQAAALLLGDSIYIPAIYYIATTGWTTADLQAAISSARLQDTFDVVTLLIGVNDQYQGIDTGTYRVNFTNLLQTSIQLAKNNKQNVIVISIPDYGVTPFGSGDSAQITAQLNEFNAINKRITLSYGISYVDVTTLSLAAATDPTLLANDGLHYSPKEYALWAQEMAPVMYQVLK